MEKRGFNLLELLIVVMIIGVLAGIALPNYLQVQEKTRGAEARNTLIVIYRNYKVALAEQGNIFAGTLGPPVASQSWGTIYMNNPNDSTRSYFAYWVVFGGPTARAERRNVYVANTTNTDAARWLQIDLNTGDITSSSEY